MKTLSNALLLALSTLTLAGASYATVPDDPIQGPDTAMEVYVTLEGWTGSLRLESDGDVELADGQQIGEWSTTPMFDSDEGSIAVSFGPTSSMEFSYFGTPQAGDGGMALLAIGDSYSAGTFEFTVVPEVEPCVEERVETCYCISDGTEQHSDDPNRHIKKVIMVKKCGVFWYEAELVDGTRHKIDEISIGGAGSRGKGTTSFDGKVSFVSWKPCP